MLALFTTGMMYFMTLTVGRVVAAMDELFPRSYAESWDKIGLVVGDMGNEVHRVAFAVDPCEATVTEAIERGADLLITHHPMYLRGTHSITNETGKGRWTTSLIKNDVALFTAHTNADVVASTMALANLLGVAIERPLDESTGIGGVGKLAVPLTLRCFAELVDSVLPPVPAGVMMAGDPDTLVNTVAICSGSGDSLLGKLHEVNADVYVTADLRHHPATDHLWNGGCALVNATHWASEWPVLQVMRDRLLQHLATDELDSYISTIPTDAWVKVWRH